MARYVSGVIYFLLMGTSYAETEMKVPIPAAAETGITAADEVYERGQVLQQQYAMKQNSISILSTRPLDELLISKSSA